MDFRRIFAGAGSIMILGGVAIHFEASRALLPVETRDAIIQFLSYFTILSNLAAAWCLATIAVFGSRPLPVSRPEMVVVFMVNLLVTGAVYAGILRPLWSPEGWMKITDAFLHFGVPLFFFLFWWFFEPRRAYRWSILKPGLQIPFAYLGYSLFRGYATGFYPYPFLDAKGLGYLRVFLNSSVLFLIFVLVYLVLILFPRPGVEKESPSGN